ncbi:MAG: DUF3472 domain-containing protein [Verrucomicrobiota bacterium]|nr:DUF3472 domain-containing protein [Verrucomicrobiota bacterium]MDG1893204.1 DUF3472 domain-containing protein [Verrucomicrobiota bacterium]
MKHKSKDVRGALGLRIPTLCIVWLLLHASAAQTASLIVPAQTAYLQPDQGGARISAQEGILNWMDPETEISWFGKTQHPGKLHVGVRMRWKEDGKATFEIKVGNLQKVSTENARKGEEKVIPFGSLEIPQAGYHSFNLRKIIMPGNDAPAVDVLSLEMDGKAANGAHFNLKPRRNAASVHLVYPVKKNAKVAAFYCEMTATEDPVYSYYMACGWHRGYFGMQVNSSQERRIIFSVWDKGGEPLDPEKVRGEDRVQLVKKGDGVFTGRFGNEGTGGHSHLKYPWATNTTQKFLVTATPVNATHTRFSGYYFHPDSLSWMLISSWDTPGEGGYLRGLYSFSENFVGRNGHLQRKALYGNQWIADPNGKWEELTTAKFSHDSTGKEDRLDRFMGLENGHFFLSHGGFLDDYTEYGKIFQRLPTGTKPMNLPPF